MYGRTGILLGVASVLWVGACGSSHDGTDDAGSGVDAAAPDAGSTDAGDPDAGGVPDAGAGDAGPGPVDGGPPPPDAAGPCGDLTHRACLETGGCVPTYDDACCPSCGMGGPCADCVDYAFHACHTEAAGCAGSLCSVAPTWLCGVGEPDCSGAHVVSERSCDVVGCVPAYPSGEGEPDPGAATCVPIRRSSCTVLCRRVEPPCPTGTVAEGDGSCYTDRCIPAFVCRR